MAVIRTFFRNLEKSVKDKILENGVIHNMKKVLERDILLLKSENEDFDMNNKKIIEQIEILMHELDAG